MKQASSSSSSAKERARRAKKLLSKCDPAAIPKGTKLVSFRDLTPAERAHGNSLGARAAELLREKRQKITISR